MKQLSVIISVYNSRETLPELFTRLNDALKEIDFEIIFVNDGSADRSFEVIRELAEKHAFVTGVDLLKNSGQDNAVMAGLSMADGEFSLIMDDDLQHAPSDIPLLLAKAREGYDVVYGSFPRKHHALWKRIGSWFNGKVAEWLVDKPSGIYLSPFKIIRRNVVREIVKYRGPYPYVQGLLLSVTRNLAQVEIPHHARYKGESNYTLIRSMSVFLKLATNFSVIPLRIASVTGMGTALVGFVLAVYYLWEYFALDSTVEGWTTLVTLILFLGGLVLMSLGLIGEYLGRTYLTVNGSPQYSIREIAGRPSKS